MALPVINTPTFDLTIPSTKKKVKFRPFLVKEEKALLIAQQSDDASSMAHTVKDIINACSFGKLDVDILATFDIEYIFCQLRGKSVGEIVELFFNCLACNDPKGKVKIEIDLTKIDVIFSKDHKDTVKLNDTIGIKMKYPSFETLERIGQVDGNDVDAMFKIIIDSIDYIFDGDEIYAAKEQTQEELMQFIENLTQDQFEQIQKFFDTMPALEKEIEFDCPNCGHHHKDVIRGLNSFF